MYVHARPSPKCLLNVCLPAVTVMTGWFGISLNLWLLEFPIRWMNYGKISLVHTRQPSWLPTLRVTQSGNTWPWVLYLWLTQLHWGVGGWRCDGRVNQGYLLHCTYHRVLPSWVGPSFVSVRVALPGVRVPVRAGVPAGTGLPRGFYPSPGCFVVVPTPAAAGGWRGHVLPDCCAVWLTGAGRRGVVPRVLGLCARLGERNTAGVARNRRVVIAARVGRSFSHPWSGVRGIIIWIPPEK